MMAATLFKFAGIAIAGLLTALPLACASEHMAAFSASEQPELNNAEATARDVSGFAMFHPRIQGAMFEYETPNTETVLETGWHGLGASPTHVAVIGTPTAGTVRCDWHGFVMTNRQRESALRHMLDLAPNRPIARG